MVTHINIILDYLHVSFRTAYGFTESAHRLNSFKLSLEFGDLMHSEPGRRSSWRIWWSLPKSSVVLSAVQASNMKSTVTCVNSDTLAISCRCRAASSAWLISDESVAVMPMLSDTCYIWIISQSRDCGNLKTFLHSLGVKIATKHSFTIYNKNTSHIALHPWDSWLKCMPTLLTHTLSKNGLQLISYLHP